MPALFRGLPSSPITEADWLTLTVSSQTWQAIGSLARPCSGRDHPPGGCFRGSANDADAAWLAGEVAYLPADGDCYRPAAL